MPLVEIKLKPSRRELKWFGLWMSLFLGAVGMVIYFKVEAEGVAYAIWIVAGLLTTIYYALRPMRRPIYLGWMYTFYPLGWTISHLVLALVYYMIITPIGVVLRLFGHDSTQRKRDPHASTYWTARRHGESNTRYFRQF